MSDDEKIFKYEDVPPGFIRDFTTRLMERLHGANKDYIQMIAEIMLAGVSYKIGHWNRIGKMNLGLWGLGITLSGEWKSVPIKEYVIPTIRNVERRLPPSGRVIKRILVPSRFSPEGLITFMTVHPETIFNEDTGEEEEILVVCNEGLMVRDEFTSLMKGVKSKDWMSDVSELLSEVYDTSIQPYFTKKDKLQEVPYCNISFLMATTPYIYDILDDTFFLQGLGNRVDYVVFDPPEEPPKIDPDEFFGDTEGADKGKYIEDFANQLSAVLQSNIKYIAIDPLSKAAKLWTKYKYECETKKRQLPKKGLGPLKWSYYSRQPEKALRRACIYCISRNIHKLDRMPEDMDTLVVSQKDMEYAIARQKLHFFYFDRLLNRWIRRPKGRRASATDIADLERMLAIIDATPYKMITAQQWMAEAGYGFRNKFYELKSTLVIQGDVEELKPEEVMRLPKEQLKWLDVKDERTKVYRLTEKYFRERKGKI